MKKTTKILLSIAAIFATVGLALMIAASMMGGGVAQIYQLAQNGDLNFGNWHFEDGVYYKKNNVVKLPSLARGNEHCESTYGTEIKNIKINADIADIVIETAAVDKLTIKMEKGYLRYYTEQVKNKDTLEITYDVEGYNYKEGPNIYVYVPKNFKLSAITVDNQMGDIEVEGLKEAEKLDLYTAMGDVELEDCELKENFKGYTSMGNVVVQSGIYQEATLESNMGDVKFYGKAEGDLTLSTSMGDAIAKVDGNEEDFDIKIETNMGSVTYNKQKHDKNIRGEYHRNGAHAKARIELNSSMGDVELSF